MSASRSSGAEELPMAEAILRETDRSLRDAIAEVIGERPQLVVHWIETAGSPPPWAEDVLPSGPILVRATGYWTGTRELSRHLAAIACDTLPSPERQELATGQQSLREIIAELGLWKTDFLFGGSDLSGRSGRSRLIDRAIHERFGGTGWPGVASWRRYVLRRGDRPVAAVLEALPRTEWGSASPPDDQPARGGA
jgi:hypothetical protein